MRKVEYFSKRHTDKDNNKILHESDCIGTALFHKFGVDYETFQTDDNNYGTGMFSTAIIELEDGTIKNVYVELIKFIDDDDEVKTVDTVNIPGNNDKLYYNPDECCIHQCQNCISGNLVPKTVDKFFCTDCGLLNDNLWKQID